MNWVVRNWLIVAAALVLLTTLGGYLEMVGFRVAGAALLGIGWSAAAILAIGDGLCRVAGKACLLGTGRGFHRLLAAIQIFLAGLLLISLLSVIL